jgi:hypothetical protein
VSWHPLFVAVTVLDVIASVLVISAALPYARVLLDWDPDSTDRRQIALEASTEGASLATRIALVAFAISTVVLTAGITLILPALVPGAMCGTGVLEAMDGQGGQALVLRGLAFAVLWVWKTLDGLNRSHPRPTAVPLVARWHLLGLPIMALAAVSTFRATQRLDPHRAVSCCQMVYDGFASPEEASTLLGVSDTVWIAAFALGVALLGGLSLWLWFRAAPTSAVFGLTLFVSAAWLPVAGGTLVRVLAPYHYEVLHHSCPWCLFLPEHHMVGYPLFAALIVIGLEALASFVSALTVRAHPVLGEFARRRQRRALLMLAGSLAAFVVLSSGPALLWRLSYGVWMSGA